MSGHSHPIPVHGRLWAAVMLWVWLVSQSLCVAHCHGVLEDALAPLSTPSRDSRVPASAHRCCSRSRTSTVSEEAPRSAVVGPDGSSLTTGLVARSVPHSAPVSDEFPCASRAVLSRSVGNPTPDLIPAWIPGWIPAPGCFSDCGDLAGSGSTRPAAPQRLSDGDTRWFDQALPRRDAGFEPAVCLGHALRSLAPPRYL